MPSKEQVGLEIVTTAEGLLGLVETKSNAEWDDPKTPGPDLRAKRFKQWLLSVGWNPGWAYCASTVEAVYRQTLVRMAAPPAIVQRIATQLCPSVMKSYARCHDQITKSPIPGDIMFMQKGHTPYGHAGIVTAVHSGWFETIEANTSKEASSAERQREGEGIFRKKHNLDFSRRDTLWIVGFLNPPSW